MLRISQKWHEEMTADELYEVTRGWWVMSPKKAESVTRVLAVAGGIVQEVYEPHRWIPSPAEGEENRIGFDGAVAPDRTEYVGLDVSHLFRPGSANPVRYVQMSALQAPAETVIAEEPPAEPDLIERVLPLLDAFDGDLMWAQSRAAQELFHSNTIAWLISHFPGPMTPVLKLLSGEGDLDQRTTQVWREYKNLDIALDPGEPRSKVVVENKLYSVPYPEQLAKYTDYDTPWSKGHGAGGAANTRYVLLSLMPPAFVLPDPWVTVDYADLAEALDAVDADTLGRSRELFRHYRALVHRLLSLAEAVNPAQTLDEPFALPAGVNELLGTGLKGDVTRLRFSHLARIIQSRFPGPRAFEVTGARDGLISYWRRLSPTRRLGWQFQSQSLRYQMTIEDPHLQGKAKRHERERIVEAEHLDFFDFREIEVVLGRALTPKTFAPGSWLSFDPDNVYRNRGVKKTASTAELADALTAATRHVDRYVESR